MEAFGYVVKGGIAKSSEFYNACQDAFPKSGNPFVLTRAEIARDLQLMKRLPKRCIDLNASSMCQKISFVAATRRMVFGDNHEKALRLTLQNTLGAAQHASAYDQRFRQCRVVAEREADEQQLGIWLQ